VLTLIETDEDVRRSASEVLMAALARLHGAPYSTVRRIACDFDRGVLTLHGTVDSYYQKQYAQELVRNVDGIRQVANRVEVMAS